jgi:hypothetical protein
MMPKLRIIWLRDFCALNLGNSCSQTRDTSARLTAAQLNFRISSENLKGLLRRECGLSCQCLYTSPGPFPLGKGLTNLLPCTLIGTLRFAPLLASADD